MSAAVSHDPRSVSHDTDEFFQGVSSFELLPPRVITLQARCDF